MEIQVEIRKLQVFIQNLLKEIPLLMPTNQNKALFIIVNIQNKALRFKIKQSSENSHKSLF